MTTKDPDFPLDGLSDEDRARFVEIVSSIPGSNTICCLKAKDSAVTDFYDEMFDISAKFRFVKKLVLRLIVVFLCSKTFIATGMASDEEKPRGIYYKGTIPDMVQYTERSTVLTNDPAVNTQIYATAKKNNLDVYEYKRICGNSGDFENCIVHQYGFVIMDTGDSNHWRPCKKRNCVPSSGRSKNNFRPYLVRTTVNLWHIADLFDLDEYVLDKDLIQERHGKFFQNLLEEFSIETLTDITGETVVTCIFSDELSDKAKKLITHICLDRPFDQSVPEYFENAKPQLRDNVFISTGTER